MTERAAHRRSRVRGAATVEYAVVTMAIVTALFIVPIPPTDLSAVAYLLEALRQFQDHTTYLLSLP